MRSYRLLTRDSHGRVLTLRNSLLRKTSTPIVAVLSYDGDTRVPLSICVRGKITLERLPGGSYTSTGRSEGMTSVTDLRLNQRTGKLDWWDSVSGFCEADIWDGRTANDEGYRGLVIVALILFPPAWPFRVYTLVSLALESIRDRLRKPIAALLDFVTGAYRV